MTKPSKTMLERFEEKYMPEPNSGCFLWLASVRERGYGQFAISRIRAEGAHRVAWRLYRGEIPKDAHVLHRCDNPSCVNPDHLFLGDNAANVADRIAKARSAGPKGSANAKAKLSENDVIAIRADGRGHATVAREYNVKPSIISKIRSFDRWKHIPHARND